ncbi:MAG: DUF3365 domain-containing protein [Phycisphaerales bacterium]
MNDHTADISPSAGEPRDSRVLPDIDPARTASNVPGVPQIGMEVSGDVIGPYKILQLIGEGGFGNVYMAQQSAPVKRRVAIKIVKPGMDSKQVVGRFESERQALAMMDHPNIARVFDAGATPTGRPYFVMELVKGVPITEHCDVSNWTTEERLKLFQDVCHAVQHAHHKGIVHRDIKPSNVLVTLHDDKPVVKVIDFGIAKAMNQDLTEGTVFTEFRQFIGTPEYMSPEQAAMSGLDVDTRSDIYSLGVLLYELLTGSTPIERDRLRSASLPEMQRMIREDEPPRPSTRLSKVSKGEAQKATKSAAGDAKTPAGSTTRGSAEDIARHRRTDVRSLRSELSGDLDWIVMKCLEKDRTRRYQTAADLAEDIEHYLKHEPIDARPPSVAYTVRKFAQRHRIAFGVAGGGLCALLLTLVALAYGLRQAQRSAEQTAWELTVARAEMMLSMANSVRRYTNENVKPKMQEMQRAISQTEGGSQYHDFDPVMVPAFSARQLAGLFSQRDEYKDFMYREASQNPTNKENKADEFESSLIESFRKDPELKQKSDVIQRAGKRTYFIAKPMVIADKKCLDCHTTPDMAPKEQVALYGTEGGYGWKFGDVVATQVVYVPVSEAFKAKQGDSATLFGTMAGVLLLGGAASLLMLRR